MPEGTGETTCRIEVEGDKKQEDAVYKRAKRRVSFYKKPVWLLPTDPKNAIIKLLN